jgi:hypothetical protein
MAGDAFGVGPREDKGWLAEVVLLPPAFPRRATAPFHDPDVDRNIMSALHRRAAAGSGLRYLRPRNCGRNKCRVARAFFNSLRRRGAARTAE